MRRPRLAAVTAVCILAVGVLTDVALGGPPSSVAAASDTETERSGGGRAPARGALGGPERLVLGRRGRVPRATARVGRFTGRRIPRAVPVGRPGPVCAGLGVGSHPVGSPARPRSGSRSTRPGRSPPRDGSWPSGSTRVGRPVSHRGAAAGGPGTVVLDAIPQPPGRYWVTVSADSDGHRTGHDERRRLARVALGRSCGRPRRANRQRRGVELRSARSCGVRGHGGRLRRVRGAPRSRPGPGGARAHRGVGLGGRYATPALPARGPRPDRPRAAGAVRTRLPPNRERGRPGAGRGRLPSAPGRGIRRGVVGTARHQLGESRLGQGSRIALPVRRTTSSAC